MNKSDNTIKCWFVQNAESEEYIEKNNLKDVFPSQYNAKIKSQGGTTYCDRNEIIKSIAHDINSGTLQKGTKIVTEKYITYIFDNKISNKHDKYKIIISQQEDPDKDYYIQSQIIALDKLTNVSSKIKNIENFKKIVAGFITVGAIVAAGIAIKKTSERELEKLKQRDSYSDYYDGIISPRSYDEMVKSIQESYEEMTDNKEKTSSKSK